MKYVISACLMGANCKYNGGNNYCRELSVYLKDHSFVCVCPEVLGGLPTPRACAEIRGDRVINSDQKDISEAFKKGAELALQTAQEIKADAAILQSRSPSCGVGKRYSGSFDQTLINGNGIYAQMLIDHQIPVIDIEALLQQINKKSGPPLSGTQSDSKKTSDK